MIRSILCFPNAALPRTVSYFMDQRLLGTPPLGKFGEAPRLWGPLRKRKKLYAKDGRPPVAGAGTFPRPA